MYVKKRMKALVVFLFYRAQVWDDFGGVALSIMDSVFPYRFAIYSSERNLTVKAILWSAYHSLAQKAICVVL